MTGGESHAAAVTPRPRCHRPRARRSLRARRRPGALRIPGCLERVDDPHRSASGARVVAASSDRTASPGRAAARASASQAWEPASPGGSRASASAGRRRHQRARSASSTSPRRPRARRPTDVVRAVGSWGARVITWAGGSSRGPWSSVVGMSARAAPRLGGGPVGTDVSSPHGSHPRRPRPGHGRPVTLDLPLALGGMSSGPWWGHRDGRRGLMTPMLVFFFKRQPLTAISANIVVSLLMKPVGAAGHLRRGTVNLELVKWLCMGSVPMAFAGAWLIRDDRTRRSTSSQAGPRPGAAGSTAAWSSGRPSDVAQPLPLGEGPAPSRARDRWSSIRRGPWCSAPLPG